MSYAGFVLLAEYCQPCQRFLVDLFHLVLTRTQVLLNFLHCRLVVHFALTYENQSVFLDFEDVVYLLVINDANHVIKEKPDYLR